MANRLGDVELDARGIRALAHPVRLAILRRLREQGPSTASKLAPSVGASPSVTSWHLRHLAGHGLVEDAPGDRGGGRSRWWQAAGAGFRFEVDPADPEPGLALLDALEADEGDLVGQWNREVRPRVEPEWLALASRWNTGITVTRNELRALSDAMEALLEPLVNRSAGEMPDGARKVRVLRYTLPAAPESE
jgi:DNA-binding transcriptional ArsR family regulator